MSGVHECAHCGRWFCGAAEVASGAPRDVFGRVERSYLDAVPAHPRYCNATCRDEAESPVDPHAERMLDGGSAVFGRTDDGYEDPRDFA